MGGLRLGLIGLGRIGAFHARSLAALDAEPAGSREELLASGVDGVLVAAATDTHPTLVLAAVDAGLPVFCEKPIAVDIADVVGYRAARSATVLTLDDGTLALVSNSRATSTARSAWTRSRPNPRRDDDV